MMSRSSESSGPSGCRHREAAAVRRYRPEHGEQVGGGGSSAAVKAEEGSASGVRSRNRPSSLGRSRQSVWKRYRREAVPEPEAKILFENLRDRLQVVTGPVSSAGGQRLTLDFRHTGIAIFSGTKRVRGTETQHLVGAGAALLKTRPRVCSTPEPPELGLSASESSVPGTNGEDCCLQCLTCMPASGIVRSADGIPVPVAPEGTRPLPQGGVAMTCQQQDLSRPRQVHSVRGLLRPTIAGIAARGLGHQLLKPHPQDLTKLLQRRDKCLGVLGVWARCPW